METTKLTHANPTIAQTWNHLSINDARIKVPALPEASLTPAAQRAYAPKAAFAAIETSGGPEMDAWIDASAGVRYHERLGHTREDYMIIEICGSCVYDIDIDDNSTCRVVIVTPQLEKDSVASLDLRINVGADSHLELFEIVAAGRHATFLETRGIRIESNSLVEVHDYILECKTCVTGLVGDLVGERADLELTGRYFVSDGEHLDMNYLARMRGRDTVGTLMFSGVLEEGARKRLSDTIDLIHGCKGAKGNENETVLVTGRHVRNQSLPSVLCKEDDVEGNHGVTMGTISPEHLAYLAGRGLNASEAEALFTRSIFDDCLAQVPEACECILEAARRALGSQMATEIEESAQELED